jgi:hypothetical protein
MCARTTKTNTNLAVSETMAYVISTLASTAQMDITMSRPLLLTTEMSTHAFSAYSSFFFASLRTFSISKCHIISIRQTLVKREEARTMLVNLAATNKINRKQGINQFLPLDTIISAILATKSPCFMTQVSIGQIPPINPAQLCLACHHPTGLQAALRKEQS